MISDFPIKIPDSEIDDLKKRIKQTRWPDEVNDSNWLLGTKLEFLKEFTHYWAEDFDWRIHEEKLNKTGSSLFKSSKGLNIHFLHKKSEDKNAIPILMTHGWPGSVQEFLKVIPILNKGLNGICFDVVCPAMPGYGFSDKPTSFGMDSQEIAKIENELMLELGYNKYIAQGGDWGATVSKWIAELFPDNCIGLHLNLVLAFPPAKNAMKGLTKDELQGLENYRKWQTLGHGYAAIQSTKPQTLGYGLNDSPVGLAGWIVEKFHAWSSNNEDNLVIDKDEALAIISLYWFTQSITSSTRLYYENNNLGFSKNYINCPTGGILFDYEIARPPKAWAEKIYNLVHWTRAKGGHFAAMETPEILAKDIADFALKVTN
mgnify:FL=1